jgi:hypothetical protein
VTGQVRPGPGLARPALPALPALLALLAPFASGACNNDVVVRPVIDSPPSGSDGAAFADLDTIELSVALEGEQESLVATTFRRGEPLEISGVPYGENLVIHMLGRVNNAEVAYGRTCRFAVRADEDPPEPHLYFARTVRWADWAMPPSAVRIGGSAVSSRNGTALYVGGLDGNNATVRGADRYDPRTGRFEELATLTPRIGGAAATLGDGRAVVVGGVDHDGVTSAVLDLISIDATSEQAVEPLFAPQLVSSTAPALATLSDGRVVAIGGRDVNGTPIEGVTEIASDGGFTTIRMLSRAKLAFPRYGHTVTRLSDDLGAPVLIAGGRDGTGTAVETAELYRPLVEQVAPTIEFAKEIQVPRWDHAAVRLPDGSVLIVGGRNANGPVASLELFTLEAGFIVQGFLPAGSGLTDFSVTSLPDGRVLIAGGRDASGTPVDAVFIVRIDPLGGGINVINTDRLAVPRAGHEATLLCDGTVLLVGGTTTPTAAERYNPPSSGRR